MAELGESSSPVSSPVSAIATTWSLPSRPNGAVAGVATEPPNSRLPATSLPVCGALCSSIHSTPPTSDSSGMRAGSIANQSFTAWRRFAW